jgi:hypothetical protein
MTTKKDKQSITPIKKAETTKAVEGDIKEANLFTATIFNFPIINIGAYADSLTAFEAFFSAIPVANLCPKTNH